jgi:DNA-binding XRE family transcriptional regulator
MNCVPAFGAELRRLRHDARVSLTELARRVHYSKGHLSKIENGRARPTKALASLCDQTFRTGGTLAAMVPPGHVRRRGNVLLEIGARTHAAVRLPVMLDIPEATTECAAPDIGGTAAQVCCVLRLHGLCGRRCVFTDQSAEAGSALRYTDDDRDPDVGYGSRVSAPRTTKSSPQAAARDKTVHGC